MKKIQLYIIGAFVTIFFTAFLSFAAEGKKTLPTTPAVPQTTVSPSTQTKQQPVPEAAKQAQQPQQPASSTTQAVTPSPIPPLAPTSADTYSYNPLGKPDPFQIIPDVIKAQKDIEAKKQEANKPAGIKAERSIFPLQQYATETYRVVGIGGDSDHRVAMVEDGAKKFYPLTVGTHIGLYKGKVVEILADRVVVEEYETKKPKRIILKLRKN